MSKASLLELCHDEKKYETFSISEYTMKACFPIVGEKEYKDSTLRTEQRQFVFTKLRVESVFISFVSFSFNKRHVSVPTRTSIRARVRSACKKLFVSFGLFVFKIISCSNSSERHATNKIREIRVR